MSYAVDPVEAANLPIPPEQRLFVGVIVNAAIDAASGITNSNRPDRIKREIEDARIWFTDDGDDFRTVCELAGLEPHRVRTGVLQYLERIASDPKHAKRHRRSPTSQKPRSYGPSISDVAEHAGVSASTVSNVIKGTGTVTDHTRAKVRRAIEALGFVHSSDRMGAQRVH
jgi:AraC-like DNA-binding protein